MTLAGTETVLLKHGALKLEVDLHPFAFTLFRGPRRLLRAGGAWAAEGTVHDRFVQLTEGVIAHEELDPRERATTAQVAEASADRLSLALTLHGGRAARLDVLSAGPEAIAFRLEAAGAPLRLALDWARRSEERFVGLGARHCTRLDQAGRTIQLGADRRYTGPDCPPEMLSSSAVRPSCSSAGSSSAASHR